MATVEATIEVERRGDGWAVRVQGPAGNVKLPKVAPLVDADLAELAARPENAAGWPEHARTWERFVEALCPNGRFMAGLQHLEAVGALLRSRLLGEASGWLSEMEQRASQERAALRFALVLDEDTPELEAIPWELCRQGTSFLFKRAARVAARCVGEMPFAPAARLRAGDTLLIATAHEDNRAPTEDDLRNHADAVKASAERIGLVVEHLPNATRDDLRERLLDASRPLHALYVVCHGQHDSKHRGRLALRGVSVSGADLAAWVAERAEQTGPLEAVILCACSSSVPAPGTSGMAQWLVKKDARWAGLRCSAVRASVGFRGPVHVTWALRFMERLFEAVGKGATVDVAVSTARAYQDESNPQWALPLLYTPHLDASAESVRAAARSPRFESFKLLVSLLPRAPVPYFVARQVERAQLAGWLKTPGCAAITSVAGEGGVGKTELAYMVAHDAVRSGRTVLWLDVVGRDLRALASTLLRHVNPRVHIDAHEDDDAVAGRAREALRSYGGLLVLDDVADARTVRALAPGGGWNVLVTTRTPGLVPGVEDVALQLMTAGEGMALLSHIAWDADVPPPEDAEASRRLVETLGGLPLAIDLAGHTIRSAALSAADYLASYHLPEGLAASDRVRAEVALLRARRDLDEGATHALQVLALLPLAGATRGMVATAIELSEPEADRALARLRRLGIAGFLVTNGRYTLHPIVRAAVRREAEADGEVWERVLAGVERAMGEIAEPLPVGDDAERALGHWRMVRDLVDTLDLTPWERMGRGSAVLVGLLCLADNLRVDEALDVRLEYIESAVRLAARCDASVRAYARLYRGGLRQLQGKIVGAEEDYEEALILFEQANDRLGQANVRLARGRLRHHRGNLGGAAEDFDEALTLFERENGRLGKANARLARGELRLLLRVDLDGASEDFEVALKLSKEVGYQLGQANARRLRGELRLLLQVDMDGAAEDFEVALKLYEEVGDRFGQANVLQARGRLRFLGNDLPGAASDYERALMLSEEVGDRLGQANIRQAQGDLAMAKEDAAAALLHYRAAETTYRDIEGAHGLSNVLANIAYASALVGKTVDASQAANEALEVGERARSAYAIELARKVLDSLAASTKKDEISA